MEVIYQTIQPEVIMYSQSQNGCHKTIPNFSNLSYAVGLFSTRAHQHFPLENNRLYFGQRTLDSLACFPFFFEYNFAKCYIDQMGELQFDYSYLRFE